MHQLCKSAQWAAVEGVIVGYNLLLQSELFAYIPKSNDDPHLSRMQAGVRAVTNLFNEFKRLDDIAIQLEFKEGNEDENQG